jgi:hypothetical protein
MTRRNFLRLGAAAIGGGALATSLYEPHQTKVSQITIKLRRLPKAFDGLRIAQLSDIHFNSFMTPEHLRQVVAMAAAQHPDLVAFTGDFVTGEEDRKLSAEQAWPCAEILRTLQAPLGAIAVLGNHDYETNAEEVAAAVASEGKIRLLRNQAFPVERDGQRLWLAGVDNVTAHRARPELAVQGIPRDECTLVAVHEPDIADVMCALPVDFQMSGHSHGGQIRFPVVGPLYLPPWARKYTRGHYHIERMHLYTNSGIGVIGLPMRFLCPPEISVFTLRAV